ncbi:MULTISPECIES: YggT family protein [Clostridium]|uniref:YGGT family protein n=2 Tax=Clostridium TaxID=1485 RepID=A0A151AQ95_9CLOT|nr:MULTISPECIES: YggT family protein [Clostridium]KYH29785.1 YGGT family protein [Clostridium colicanis DSM 13634]MBE6044774.1 YggT family protein [Clostridium thermopalmarium]PRR75166.1 YGGT family protein [Clostridium thermopalmarium DSM 5974]PVZ27922.1 YggT family protein [Clostridium thermopalmarium DSM 5974]
MILLQKAFSLLFSIIELLIMIDVILSWIYIKDNSFTRLIHIFTEPFLSPGRKIQDRLMPGLPVDLSPIMGLFILWIIESIVNTLLGIF